MKRLGNEESAVRLPGGYGAPPLVELFWSERGGDAVAYKSQTFATVVAYPLRHHGKKVFNRLCLSRAGVAYVWSHYDLC